MLLTFFGTIIWSVEVGVLVSLVISLLLVVHRSSKTRMMILASGLLYILFVACFNLIVNLQGRIPGTDRWKPISEDPEAKEDTSGIVIIRIRENLDFGPYTEPFSSFF
jgi:MFS superfamily sulfate permease-like transporter